MLRATVLAAAAAGAAAGGGNATLPTSMRAFVKSSAFKSAYEASFSPVPALGDLHKKYTGLPDSCEVLVKVMASSINPSDISPTAKVLPHVTGSDMSGVVAAVQSSCKRLKVGDKVWADIGANCGNGKELGGYGEYAAALESQLSIMPSNIDFMEAGSLGKVALTSYKALVWYGGAGSKEQGWKAWSGNPTVAVLGGSGGCGTTGIQLAKAFGAGTVVTTTSADNFDYCKGLGADQLIDYQTQNWWDVLADGSVDVIYDTVGQSGTGDHAMKKLKAGGYLVSIAGGTASKPRSDVHQAMFINSDTNLDNNKELDALSAIISKGHLRMKHFYAVLPLSEVAQGFKISESHLTVGKVVISVSNSTDL